MINAGRALFYRLGFQSVTTDMLAQEAGTSKSTLYSQFGDKTGLLSAVIEQEAARFWIGARDIPRTADGYYETLFGYGAAFLELLSDPDVQRFERLILSEAQAHPEGAGIFFARAHGATMDDLARLIAVGIKEAFIASRYPPLVLADSLSSVWRGITHARIQMGLNENGFDDIPAHVERGLDLVLGLRRGDFDKGRAT
jgi:AcrR family transcriptional regulator